jgi:hypothetical protein
MTVKKRDRPKSVVAEVVQNMLDEEFKELGGLNDFVIQRISFWVSEILGFSNFKLMIDYKSEPKKIIIQIRDANDRPTGIVPKGANDYESLREFLGIGDYKIEFEKGENYDENKETD